MAPLRQSLVAAWVLATLTLVSIAAPATALAHPLVDEGRRLYEEAEFVQALDTLGRAEGQSDLTLADLEVLFEQRALVNVALGNQDAVRADLRRLLAVAPDHHLARGAPPDVARLFAELRAESTGAVRVVATTESSADGVTVLVRAENDWAGVVRAVRTSGRVVGTSDWDSSTDAPLLVATVPGDRVEYFAEAIGPGGAVLARSGSADAPLSAAAGAAAPIAASNEEIWPFIVGGVGGLVVIGVIIAVVVVATSPPTVQTQLSPFTVRF